MTQKSNDRLQAIRERAAALKRRPAEHVQPEPPAEGVLAAADSDEVALSAHFGIAALDAAASGRTMQRLAVGAIAPDLRPEARQARLLPLPDELTVDGVPASAQRVLVAELVELGQSLQERQIQPIIVYPGTSAHYPAAHYLILIGHRRWTAAWLVGLGELDAIVVEPPDPIERVQLQYAENEERADFTDMERAWALQQMKQVLGDAPWEIVETRFRMSSSRRHELTRLLAFTAEQQKTVARLRLRENQLVPLHQAIRAGDLSTEHVDRVLTQIESKAYYSLDPVGGRTSRGIDGATIARIVAQTKRDTGSTPARVPQWLPALHTKVTATSKELKRLQLRFAELGDVDRAGLQKELDTLQRTIERSLEMLDEAGGSQ